MLKKRKKTRAVIAMVFLCSGNGAYGRRILLGGGICCGVWFGAVLHGGIN